MCLSVCVRDGIINLPFWLSAICYFLGVDAGSTIASEMFLVSVVN